MKKNYAYSLMSKIILFGLLFIENSCSHEDLLYSEVANDDIISLTVSPTTIRADNNSLITLTVKIPKDAAQEFRTVTFLASADLGTFVGTLQSDQNKVVVNNDGTASVSIKVGTKPGNYFIAAKISDATKTYKTDDKPISVTEIPDSEKLTLSANPQSVEADGNSTITISGVLKYNDSKSATLTTNLGTFFNSSTPTQSTLSFDDTGNGSAVLKISNDLNQHIITCKITGLTDRIIVINPTRSYPEDLLLDYSTLSIDTVGSIKLNAFLIKSDVNKKVSKGSLLTLKAYQLNSGNQTTVGRFVGLNSALSDENGTIPTISFFADTGNIDRTKPITIEASVSKSANDFIIKTLNVKVK